MSCQSPSINHPGSQKPEHCSAYSGNDASVVRIALTSNSRDNLASYSPKTMSTTILDAKLREVGSEQITPTVISGLTPPAGSTYALIHCTTQGIRFSETVTVTASLGMPLAAGTYFWYTGDLNKVKFIESVSGAIVDVLYYTSD